jgi:hypothetical protein
MRQIFLKLSTNVQPIKVNLRFWYLFETQCSRLFSRSRPKRDSQPVHFKKKAFYRSLNGSSPGYTGRIFIDSIYTSFRRRGIAKIIAYKANERFRTMNYVSEEQPKQNAKFVLEGRSFLHLKLISFVAAKTVHIFYTTSPSPLLSKWIVFSLIFLVFDLRKNVTNSSLSSTLTSIVLSLSNNATWLILRRQSTSRLQTGFDTSWVWKTEIF